ncbi:unnamed protein product, partial [Iphiclides podalirius]
MLRGLSSELSKQPALYSLRAKGRNVRRGAGGFARSNTLGRAIRRIDLLIGGVLRRDSDPNAYATRSIVRRRDLAGETGSRHGPGKRRVPSIKLKDMRNAR